MTARGREAKRMDSHHCTDLCTFSLGGLLIAQRHSRRHGSSRRTEREMWSGEAGCASKMRRDRRSNDFLLFNQKDAAGL